MFEAITPSANGPGIEFDGVDNAARPVSRSNAPADAPRAPQAVRADAPADRTGDRPVGLLLDVIA